jgi:hypothetical protein
MSAPPDDKVNGVSYIVQRGASGVTDREGLTAYLESIAYYMENAKLIS